MHYNLEDVKDFLKTVLNPVGMWREVYEDTDELIIVILFASMFTIISILCWAVLPLTLVFGFLIGIKLR